VRRYVSLKSAAAVLTILLCSHFFCPAGKAALKGGCAKVNITPPLGIPLIGSYGKPSDDILDDLYAKALVLNDGNNTIAIVCADLLYTPLEEITGPARRIIKEKTDIPEEHILICATHTHSGPEVFTQSKLGPDQEIPTSEIDQPYLQTLIRKIADAAVLAHKSMREIKIGAAKGRIPEIVFNRRPKAADGSAVTTFRVSAEVAATRRIETGADGSTTVSFTLDANKPTLTFGPVDPELWVLRVEDANNNIVGSIVNFACHPVCVYPYLPTAISADFPGDATDLVEQTEGGVCLFALGTAGDIVPYQRGVKAHQQIGRALGAEALRRLQFVEASDEVKLDALKKEIKFPAKKLIPADGEREADKAVEYITTEMQVLQLGDVYILGLPGEVLAEVGLEIKKRAGIEKLFIISLSNDAIGYVCHSRAYEEGGYEPGSATNLAKGAGEIMIKEALDLLKEMRQGE
jgi:neutral ceramidase